MAQAGTCFPMIRQKLWACTLETTGENVVRKWQSAGQVWTKRMDHIHWHTVNGCLQASQVVQMVKNLPANAGHASSIPGSGRSNPPRKRSWLPIPVGMPAESDGQRSLAGYSSWQKSWTRLSNRSCMHAPRAIRAGGEWLWDTMTPKKPRIFTSAAGFLSCADTAIMKTATTPHRSQLQAHLTPELHSDSTFMDTNYHHACLFSRFCSTHSRGWS